MTYWELHPEHSHLEHVMSTTKLSFADIAELEPRVGALEKLARRAAPAAGGDPDYAVFLLEVKPLVTALVGWSRGWLETRETFELQESRPMTLSEMAELPPQPTRPRNEVEDYLRSSEAYDVVYEHLVEAIGAG